mmetsp:Transcript_60015/g.127110  ORF Transcript_60015/g.127110 Transcript_60015/m.127110 type:complete len:207 (+) Transcript_60015:184-804(+)
MPLAEDYSVPRVYASTPGAEPAVGVMLRSISPRLDFGEETHREARRVGSKNSRGRDANRGREGAKRYLGNVARPCCLREVLVGNCFPNINLTSGGARQFAGTIWATRPCHFEAACQGQPLYLSFFASLLNRGPSSSKPPSYSKPIPVSSSRHFEPSWAWLLLRGTSEPASGALRCRPRCQRCSTSAPALLAPGWPKMEGAGLQSSK